MFASALCVSRSQYDQAYASFLKWLKHHVAPPLKGVCVGTLTRRFLFSFSTPILDTQADILTVFLPFLVLFLSLLYLVFKSVVLLERGGAIWPLHVMTAPAIILSFVYCFLLAGILPVYKLSLSSESCCRESPTVCTFVHTIPFTDAGTAPTIQASSSGGDATMTPSRAFHPPQVAAPRRPVLPVVLLLHDAVALQRRRQRGDQHAAREFDSDLLRSALPRLISLGDQAASGVCSSRRHSAVHRLLRSVAGDHRFLAVQG